MGMYGLLRYLQIPEIYNFVYIRIGGVVKTLKCHSEYGNVAEKLRQSHAAELGNYFCIFLSLHKFFFSLIRYIN